MRTVTPLRLTVLDGSAAARSDRWCGWNTTSPPAPRSASRRSPVSQSPVPGQPVAAPRSASRRSPVSQPPGPRSASRRSPVSQPPVPGQPAAGPRSASRRSPVSQPADLQCGVVCRRPDRKPPPHAASCAASVVRTLEMWTGGG